MLTIILKSTKSCLPLPQIFHASNLCNVGALGSVKYTHRLMQVPKPDRLASQSRPLPISCANLDKFFSLHVPQFPHL